jgi:membrane protein YdbS with pleckstrin-like domain
MLAIVSLLTGRLRSTSREVAALAAVYALVGLFVLTTYAALVVALFLWVAREAGPIAAALSVAGLTTLASILVLVIAAMRKRSLWRRRRLETRTAMTAGTMAGMSALVPMMVRASPVGSLLAVAALAYVMSRTGESSRRRD